MDASQLVGVGGFVLATVATVRGVQADRERKAERRREKSVLAVAAEEKQSVDQRSVGIRELEVAVEAMGEIVERQGRVIADQASDIDDMHTKIAGLEELGRKSDERANRAEEHVERCEQQLALLRNP